MHELEAVGEIRRLVAEFFSEEPQKAVLWFKIANPLFGGFSAEQMIAAGRAEKVLHIIRDRIEGIHP